MQLILFCASIRVDAVELHAAAAAALLGVGCLRWSYQLSLLPSFLPPCQLAPGASACKTCASVVLPPTRVGVQCCSKVGVGVLLSGGVRRLQPPLTHSLITLPVGSSG